MALLRSKLRLSIASSAPLWQRGFATSKTLSKSAVVTGSGQGIGKAIALRLARDGFDICVNDLEVNSSMVNNVVAEIQSLGRKAIPVFADVTRLPQVEAMVEASVEGLGPLDVIVANAGIAQVQWGMDAQESDLQRLFEVNFYGVLYSDQVAARQFIKQGSGGKIINAASIVSFRPFLMLPIYSATKAAVRSLTQSLAMELAKDKITVNAYAPGVVDSHMWDTIDEGMGHINGRPKGQNFKDTVNSITLGRTSVPEDVAKMVSFLASADSDYVTGQTMMADGGMVFS
ncbi:3-oxoacyl-reductase [Rhodocollybia butyracea]|uniref:diacetyl reductase [(S)-acetoin forming] n=1 Tax=Rhodocollybia butyracea TaxID=206335 RepID=A0A9P5U426_9AGAR|nr:3-oxoacyl-reductase [Rhodocollybia butyracea]